MKGRGREAENTIPQAVEQTLPTVAEGMLAAV